VSHAINIPIRFQFVRTPCVWEIRTVTLDAFEEGAEPQTLRMLFAKIDPRRRHLGEKPQLLDAWESRREFFKLPQTENALLGFLSKVGVWEGGRAVVPCVFTPVIPFIFRTPKEITQHCREGHPRPLSFVEIWVFRESLGRYLKNRKSFIETFAPARPRPRTTIEALYPADKFVLSFELEKNPQGVVTVTDACHMLMATVYADIVRGLRFEYCRRGDCKAPFAITNNHEKFYCTQACAHLENVRKKRREAREAKRKLHGH
jgi:hypothetical protein